MIHFLKQTAFGSNIFHFLDGVKIENCAIFRKNKFSIKVKFIVQVVANVDKMLPLHRNISSFYNIDMCYSYIFSLFSYKKIINLKRVKYKIFSFFDNLK